MEFKILDYLSRHDGHAGYDVLLNAFGDPLETDCFLRLLRDNGCIRGSLDAYSGVSITSSGRACLSKLTHDMDDRAKERAYVRAQNHRTEVIAAVAAIASVAAAVFSALAYFFPR